MEWEHQGSFKAASVAVNFTINESSPVSMLHAKQGKISPNKEEKCLIQLIIKVLILVVEK